MSTTNQDELVKLDILLRRKQVFWETPKAVLLIIVTTATISGLLGWKFGSATQRIVVQLAQPVAVQIQPARQP